MQSTSLRQGSGRQACEQCSAMFEMSDADLQFCEKVAPIIANKKYSFPQEALCPTCRLQNRTCHRNERFLYKNISAYSDREIIALYEKTPLWGKPYAIYTPEEWYGDHWDPMDYGSPFDFSRTFFEQWAELHKKVPRMGLIQISNENCEYTTGTAYCKNCYLINSSEYCEECFYGKLLQSCKDSADCSYLYDSELCYDCFSVYKSYSCTTLSFSKNCTDCHFSSFLVGCRNCILCTNLTQKEYHVENRPVSKEEYAKLLASFQSSSQAREDMKKKLRALERKSPRKYANILNAENCTGDYIENSQNCIDCYDVTESQDCHYVHTGVKVKDNLDCSNMYLKVELCYQVLGAIEAYACAYCLFIFYSQRLLYSEYCLHCSDCFGCNGLQHKQYCILNKQYTKEEYEKLVPRIIEHMKNDGGGAMNRTSASTELSTDSESSGSWGRFFPSKYSPFGYNESLANEYLPLTKKEALERGFLWRDVVDEPPKVQKVIPAGRLPDQLSEIPDDVLEWGITCSKTERPYRIQRPELSLYRKIHIPIPREHPDVRYDERLSLRNPRKLWKRACGKCGEEMQTTYSPERPEKVYCEECYLKEVY